MSCELLIGIERSKVKLVRKALEQAAFESVNEKLNSFPYNTERLNEMLGLDSPHQWYVATLNFEIDLNITNILHKAIHGELGVLLRKVSGRLKSFCVLFSDYGTNEFEIIRLSEKVDIAEELMCRYRAGGPAISTALIFNRLIKSEKV